MELLIEDLYKYKEKERGKEKKEKWKNCEIYFF